LAQKNVTTTPLQHHFSRGIGALHAQEQQRFSMATATSLFSTPQKFDFERSLMATVQSKGKSVQHYFMGAYTFDRQPPFAITAISPSPIVGKNFYRGPEYKTVKPLRVVFPCGFVFDDRYIWVVYGKNE
jgi:predicted GH43/DUF377 family glycosyl hydrolase